MNKFICGDALKTLQKMESESINCCITSPPYWGLRDYGMEEQLGLEPTFELYIRHLCDIFDEVKRVLRKDGTCWVNLGDSYSGSGGDHKAHHVVKPTSKGFQHKCGVLHGGRGNRPTNVPAKSLCLIPQRFAIEMVNRGWILRNIIIWAKPNPMPESVQDRCTKSHEYIFFFVKNKRYWYDGEAIKEPSVDAESHKGRKFRHRSWDKTENYKEKSKSYPKRNKRDVWWITVKSGKKDKKAHFAVFPEKLIEPCILAGCPKGGIVLDPFVGSGTTNLVAMKHERLAIGIDLQPDYIKIGKRRIMKYRVEQSRKKKCKKPLTKN